jgi:hypothetical protein
LKINELTPPVERMFRLEVSLLELLNIRDCIEEFLNSVCNYDEIPDEYTPYMDLLDAIREKVGA